MPRTFSSLPTGAVAEPDPLRLPELVQGGDIETVKSAIVEKYGFMPSAEYVRDLIVFVEELTRAES